MVNSETKSIYEHVWALREAGRIDQAIAELRGYLSHDANDGRAWQILGTLFYDRADVAQAQAALECASVLVPLSPRAQLVLARCYDGAGHSAAAQAIYLHVATMQGFEVELLELLAAGLGRYGQFELALNVCRSAARLLPDDPMPLLGIVHYMYRLKRPIEHILPTMSRVVSLDPENRGLRIALAWMFNEVGQPAKAVAVLEQVACEEITCASCLERVQHIFEEAGDERSAAKCRAYLRALSEE